MSKYKRELREEKRIEELKEKFLLILKDNNYICYHLKGAYSDDYQINGNNIFGFFKFYEDEKYKEELLMSSINGYIAFDHKNCFTKLSRCPCFLKIPNRKNSFDSRMKYILNQLKYWGSKDGYKSSNGYDIGYFIDERKF